MWNRAGVCALLLVAATTARPSKEENDTLDESHDDLYSENNLNNGFEENGEFGEYFEGDILLPIGEPPDKIIALNAWREPDRLWPSGILPYTIKTEYYTLEQISEIENRIRDLVDSTKVNGKNCIQIIPRTTEEHYVEVYGGDGCWSELGRQKTGKQELSLNLTNCLDGAVIHEFLHALSFVHEQSRPDRDDYVTIIWDNIIPEERYNFNKSLPNEVDILGTPYDYNSIMHYPANAFAINESFPTIIPRDPKMINVMGQRGTLSPIDIERVQILYKCLRPADSIFFKDFDEKLIPQPIL